MPNPNRPQYQDTIEETWGQAVADTVVRRYTSSADRDADLAGFTPAELAGQIVAIVPGAPALPHLQIHDGTAWADYGTFGRVASIVGPPADFDVGAGYTNILSVAFAVAAGRRYKVDASCFAGQKSGSGTLSAQVVGPFGTVVMMSTAATAGANSYAVGAISALEYVPGASGDVSVEIQFGSFNASGLGTAIANGSRLLVSEIGAV
jgi:hypothetical protein